MKNYKKLWVLLSVMVISCVADDDFAVPEINLEEPQVNVNTDISTVKNMYRGYEPKRIETGDGSTEEMFVEAYVVSSDESGNIYKQLFVQDAPENPSAGVAISTNATNLYTRFEPGRKIYFRVDGLYIGEYAGLPTIGILEGDEVGRMNIEDFESRIFRSLNREDLTPTSITISEAGDPEHLATLVRFENVQFPEGLAGVQYYGNLTNVYGVNRFIENCDGETLIMRTSGYANFKNLRLPEGNGTITGILSIFNTEEQLLIRDPSDVEMTGERCTMGFGNALELPFFQDFTGLPAGSGVPVSIEGWTNVNINGGDHLWELREFSGNQYAQASAYGTNENPFEVWLVTPGLILPSGSAAVLNFNSNDGHYNGEALSVKIATDFEGDVSTATWEELNATISSGHTNGFGSVFTPSGPIDLSSYAGEIVYIAFQYVGASNGTTTTYQIDNILVE